MYSDAAFTSLNSYTQLLYLSLLLAPHFMLLVVLYDLDTIFDMHHKLDASMHNEGKIKAEVREMNRVSYKTSSDPLSLSLIQKATRSLQKASALSSFRQSSLHPSLQQLGLHGAR